MGVKFGKDVLFAIGGLFKRDIGDACKGLAAQREMNFPVIDVDCSNVSYNARAFRWPRGNFLSIVIVRPVHPEGAHRCLPRPPRSLPPPSPREAAVASCPHPSREWSATTAVSLGRAPSPFPRRGRRQWPHVPLHRASRTRPLLSPLAALPLPSLAEGSGSGLMSPSFAQVERSHCCLPWPSSLSLPSPREAPAASYPPPLRCWSAATCLPRPRSLSLLSPRKRQWPHIPLLCAGGARPLLPPLAEHPLPSLAQGSGIGLMSP